MFFGGCCRALTLFQGPGALRAIKTKGFTILWRIYLGPLHKQETASCRCGACRKSNSSSSSNCNHSIARKTTDCHQVMQRHVSGCLGLVSHKNSSPPIISLGPGMDSQGINKAFFIFAVRECRHVFRPPVHIASFLNMNLNVF